MTRPYTPTGLPMKAPWDEKARDVVSKLYALATSDNKDFNDSLELIEGVLSVRAAYGCVFSLLLEEGVKVSANAYSLVMNYAHAIVGTKAYREMTMDNKAQLLTPSSEDLPTELTISEANKATLERIAKADAADFIQLVVKNFSLVRLVELYKLYLYPNEVELGITII